MEAIDFASDRIKKLNLSLPYDESWKTENQQEQAPKGAVGIHQLVLDIAMKLLCFEYISVLKFFLFQHIASSIEIRGFSFFASHI